LREIAVPVDGQTSASTRPGDRAPRGSADRATAGATPPSLVWLNEGPLVRQAMSRLSLAPGDTLALVPVVVK
jgi:hypothetical protein